MRRNVCIAAVSFLLLVVSAGAQTVCPECYNDRSRPTGNGGRSHSGQQNQAPDLRGRDRHVRLAA